MSAFSVIARLLDDFVSAVPSQTWQAAQADTQLGDELSEQAITKFQVRC